MEVGVNGNLGGGGGKQEKMCDLSLQNLYSVIPLVRYRRSQIQILAWRPTVPSLHAFPQYSQENSGLAPQIRPRSLPSTSFPIHDSLMILLFNTTDLQCELPKALVNKPPITNKAGEHQDPRYTWITSIKSVSFYGTNSTVLLLLLMYHSCYV
jgi:hypothetical protein